MTLAARRNQTPQPQPHDPFAGSELTAEQFARISEMLHRLTGISLQAGKEQLVKARLNKRLRELSLRSFHEYVALLESDTTGAELSFMVDALTTNKTSFFREKEHFAFLSRQVADATARDGPLKIWSAGCSAGQEPYSIAITLLERSPSGLGPECKILATDISSVVLAKAKEGIYDIEELEDLPPGYARRFFIPRPGDRGRSMQVTPQVRSMVQFARLNLMGPWPMNGRFDHIFCRNVMIYFNKATQERLVSRFRELLKPGGYLFVGHSESLSGIDHNLEYTSPAVYRRSG